MNLRELRKNWDRFARTDPLWATLSYPSKRGNKWDAKDFFETGVKEIEQIMQHIESLGYELVRGKALDFGCGVGRLTQTLADYFNEVYGVDIAPSMIDLANKYNQREEKCSYLVNDSGDLQLFRDNYFDLILSLLTLQHMEWDYIKNYIKEFLRILAPSGLLIFQLPNEPIEFQVEPPQSSKLKKCIKTLAPRVCLNFYHNLKALIARAPKMEMHYIRRETVIEFLQKNGAFIIDILDVGKERKAQGLDNKNFLYFATKER